MTQSATPQPAKAEPETPAASPRALYVLLLVVFINLVGFGIVIPLLPFYAKSLNAAPWQITALFSAYSSASFSPSRSGAGCRIASGVGRC